MIISFQNKTLREVCEQKQQAIEVFGESVAHKLHNRLADIMAAENVSDLIVGSPEEIFINDKPCYLIKASKKTGIIFESSHPKTPMLPKGTIDWSQVSRIKITEIKTYDD